MTTVYDLYNGERETIQKYFAYRGYQWPSAMDALLFLTTELVELWDAVLDGDAVDLPDEMMPVYYSLRKNQRAIERYLRRDTGYVRNDQSPLTVDLAGEIGDVMMMLEVLARQMQQKTPRECMEDKMKRKGFVVE